MTTLAKEEFFNLLDEPWILAVKPNRETKTLSMLDVFRRAPEFQSLAGELPTQDVAVLRLLLAVLHAVFGRQDVDGSFAPLLPSEGASPMTALRRWKALWDRGAFPMDVIEAYLRKWEERFCLFHPERPFYQVNFEEPLIDSQGRKISPTLRDIQFFIGSIPKPFSERTENESITYPEAARWLIYGNAFDIAPAGNPGNKEEKITIKGYRLTWLNELGLVWANGSNLFETLMLNFVLYTKDSEGCDVVWESDKVCGAEDLKDITPSFPKNTGELLTMQFRRFQLKRDESRKRVTKCVLWSGHKLNTTNAFLEHMTLWDWDGKEYKPKKHQVSRQMWRDFAAILASTNQPSRAPGIVNWISDLQDKEYLKIPFIQLNIIGTSYTQNTKITDVFADSLRINLSLFSKCGDWVKRIEDVIEDTERLVKEVRKLQENLLQANGYRKKEGKDELLQKMINSAREQAYFRLDSLFRQWLEKIDPKNMDAACMQWFEIAKKTVRKLGEELVYQSGPKAFVGRMDKNGYSQTAPEAYNRFIARTSSPEALKRKEGKA